MYGGKLGNADYYYLLFVVVYFWYAWPKLFPTFKIMLFFVKV